MPCNNIHASSDHLENGRYAAKPGGRSSRPNTNNKNITMKTSLFTIFLAFSASPLYAQHYRHGQSHGDGYSSHSSHSNRDYTPPRRTYSPPAQPRRQATSSSTARATQRPSARPARDPQNRASVSAVTAQQQRARQQRQQTAERLRQVQRETLDALEQIAADAAARSRQGFDCIQQQTGGMNCYQQPDMNAPVSFSGQRVLNAPNVYSGTGAGRNNPAMQGIRNTGPIPQGTYNATGVANTLNGLNSPNVIRLEPAAGTDTLGRDTFRMHGNNRANDASQGCPIVPPATRSVLADMLRQGGQVRLNVQP